MNRIAQYLIAASLTLSVVACATDGMRTAPTMMSNGVMVNSAGMTLYTFDKDTANSGKSACNGPCAALWPAVTPADAMAGGDYSVVTRDDGSKQLAYKGKPLYLFAKDQKPGDMTGDNFKDVWHVVK
jgi:predicted lipoprotein with Yx(FWY)xxD motif